MVFEYRKRGNSDKFPLWWGKRGGSEKRTRLFICVADAAYNRSEGKSIEEIVKQSQLRGPGGYMAHRQTALMGLLSCSGEVRYYREHFAKC